MFFLLAVLHPADQLRVHGDRAERHHDRLQRPRRQGRQRGKQAQSKVTKRDNRLRDLPTCDSRNLSTCRLSKRQQRNITVTSMLVTVVLVFLVCHSVKGPLTYDVRKVIGLVYPLLSLRKFTQPPLQSFIVILLPHPRAA